MCFHCRGWSCSSCLLNPETQLNPPVCCFCPIFCASNTRITNTNVNSLSFKNKNVCGVQGGLETFSLHCMLCIPHHLRVCMQSLNASCQLCFAWFPHLLPHLQGSPLPLPQGSSCLVLTSSSVLLLVKQTEGSRSRKVG